MICTWVSADRSRRIHEVRRPGPVPEFVRAVVAATSVEAPHIDMQEANTAVSKIAAAIAEAVPLDTGSDAIAGLGPEEDAVSLDQFLSITAGFAGATVRVAMGSRSRRPWPGRGHALATDGLSPFLSCRIESATVTCLSLRLVAGGWCGTSALPVSEKA